MDGWCWNGGSLKAVLLWASQITMCRSALFTWSVSEVPTTKQQLNSLLSGMEINSTSLWWFKCDSHNQYISWRAGSGTKPAFFSAWKGHVTMWARTFKTPLLTTHSTTTKLPQKQELPGFKHIDLCGSLLLPLLVFLLSWCWNKIRSESSSL